MKIPFTKLHGAENDFLLTWGEELGTNPQGGKAHLRACNGHRRRRLDAGVARRRRFADAAIQFRR